MSDLACSLCSRPVGSTVYVVVGYLGTYAECEFCFEGRERPDEPELITDTFTVSRTAGSLDAILDRLAEACP